MIVYANIVKKIATEHLCTCLTTFTCTAAADAAVPSPFTVQAHSVCAIQKVTCTCSSNNASTGHSVRSPVLVFKTSEFQA
jgi:hypothetical protein